MLPFSAIQPNQLVWPRATDPGPDKVFTRPRHRKYQIAAATRRLMRVNSVLPNFNRSYPVSLAGGAEFAACNSVSEDNNLSAIEQNLPQPLLIVLFSLSNRSGD